MKGPISKEEETILERKAQINEEILEELWKGVAKHKNWPKDPVHGAAIVAEESGELVRAALNHRYEGGSKWDMYKEAVQTAATCIRFIANTMHKE
jgi:hypothetical protein